MNIRLLSPALIPLLFAAATADCGYHDSNVGSTQLPSASDGTGGSGGSGPCDFAKGPGSGEASHCKSGGTFLGVIDVLCEDFLAQCEKMAATDPSLNFFCNFEGEIIFGQKTVPGLCPWEDDDGGSSGSGGNGGTGGSPGPGSPSPEELCKLLPSTGVGKATDCKSGNELFSLGDCDGTLYKCEVLAETNPDLSITCQWGDTVLFRHEAFPGACIGETGSNGEGDGGSACPPNTVEVAACEAPQSPTQSCDLKCVPNDTSYQDASDNCPPPGQVVYECFSGGGCSFGCYY